MKVHSSSSHSLETEGRKKKKKKKKSIKGGEVMELRRERMVEEREVKDVKMG